jgi:hypothetical protein
MSTHPPDFWPPRKGWIAEYKDGSIYKFTGEINNSGGYNVTREGYQEGGLGSHILSSKDWTLYIPVRIENEKD